MFCLQLKRLIEAQLKSVGNWWLRCVPESSRIRIEAEINLDKQSYIEGASPNRKEDYLSFTDMLVIIERNWSYFSSVLGVKSSALHSIEAIRQIRDKLARGKEVLDLSNDEKEYFEKSILQLEKRLS